MGSREALGRVMSANLHMYHPAFLGSLLTVLLAVLAMRQSEGQLHCRQWIPAHTPDRRDPAISNGNIGHTTLVTLSVAKQGYQN